MQLAGFSVKRELAPVAVVVGLVAVSVRRGALDADPGQRHRFGAPGNGGGLFRRGHQDQPVQWPFHLIQRKGGVAGRHPADAMAMPVARLARQACVSESSVIRLCQRLGFTGYAAFKLSLAASLSAAGLDRTLDDLTIEEGEMTPARVMTRVFEQTRQALEQTMLILSPEQFARAAKLLQNAASVTFFGIGTSAPVAQDACYRFSRLPLRVNCAVDPYMMVLLASRMGPEDVAVAISHTGQSRETLRAAEQAR